MCNLSKIEVLSDYIINEINYSTFYSRVGFPNAKLHSWARRVPEEHEEFLPSTIERVVIAFIN